MTPFNKLTTIIDTTGTYTTRNGQTVTIDTIHDHSDNLNVTRFNCKGYLHTKREGKKDKLVFSIWHQSGMATAFEGPNDIVSKQA